MKTDVKKQDQELLKNLNFLYSEDVDRWSFKNKAHRSHMHSCFQYPAMMVPQMQAKLIETIVQTIPGTETLYEPFIGSGTVLTESMKQGLNLHGQDINPLAILICRTKSGPFFVRSLEDRISEVKARIAQDSCTGIEASFESINKWFKPDVSIELSRIRRAIRKERFLWCRRFFWTAMAETVRQVSNSRLSTFKLHIRSEADLASRNISPIERFFLVLESNLKGIEEKKEFLKSNGLLKNGHYIGNVEVTLNDTASFSESHCEAYDILVSSPPYGDNLTTVSYGQHSYLPLQWIDLHDIDKPISPDWLRTYGEIDRRSLGGVLDTKLIENQSGELLETSKSLKGFIITLNKEPSDRRNKVLSFFLDFSRCVRSILNNLKPNAYMVWTVGNRRVANHIVPMDKIVTELFESNECSFIAKYSRRIQSKRMALMSGKNRTMKDETILILRKGL